MTALLHKSLQAPHEVLAWLEVRRRAERNGRGDGAAAAVYDRLPFREVVQRKLPDLAMYAASVLLACVIGASIALYLR